MADASPFRMLVVCTANICRSVMAERMLREAARERGFPLAVSSCGLLFDGEPVSDTVLAVLDERGIDARDHSSRKFEPGLLDGVDVVVTMERMHARELSVAIDGASPRIHTLIGLANALRDAAPAPGSSPADRVAAVAAARPSSALFGSGPDEVADPHGRSKRVHRKTAELLEEHASRLLTGLFAD